ncbi:hypothetical protein AA15237_2876 [Komagataeibacter xylinus NBRC 15237]|nr:hypothetical protein AA15237_2876 [Komagataeibacter xylinus NBRC 15237]
MNLRGDRAIDLKTRRHEHKVGAFALCYDRRHGRAHPEPAGLITRGGNNAAPPGTTYGKRPAPQGRIIALLDRGIKGIHVNMDDAPVPCTTHGPDRTRAMPARDMTGTA